MQLLNVLKENIHINFVKCRGLTNCDFDTILILLEIFSINKSVISVDASCLILDIENGLIKYSAHKLVKPTLEEVSSLKSLLPNFNIKELSLIKCDFSNAITPLCDLIKASQSLTSVDFSHCQLTDKHVLEIVSVLESKSCVKMINLTNVNIGFHTLLATFKQFSTHQSPPILDMSPHCFNIPLFNFPLKDAENAKVSKYGHQVAALNSRRHNNIVFQPFAVSLYGNFGSSTKEFLSLFENLCSEFGKKFNRSYWKSKFAFSIFRSMYRYVDSILSKLFGGNYFSELGSSFDNLF
ncbi:hypothetical protein GEMRC1_010034 [Eukaryota sp. GEM-RC1]